MAAVLDSACTSYRMLLSRPLWLTAARLAPSVPRPVEVEVVDVEVEVEVVAARVDARVAAVRLEKSCAALALGFTPLRVWLRVRMPPLASCISRTRVGRPLRMCMACVENHQ